MMLNRVTPALILPVVMSLAVAAPAQAPASAIGHATLGKNHLVFGSGAYKPSESVFSDGVVLTAPDYDLTALTVHIFAAPVRGGADAVDKSNRQAISKIVADADLAHHQQVVGHFKQAPEQPTGGGQNPIIADTGVDQTQYYTAYADRAVYVPALIRARDNAPDAAPHPTGTLDLIGHPKLIVRAADIVQGPSTTTFKDPDAVVHVLLGKAPDYPYVVFPAGQADGVPLR